MAFEDKKDVLKLLGMMRFRSDNDDKKFDTLEDILELFYTGNMSLCQEFARLLGLQIMKDWFVETDNEDLQREIVDCISASHFKMRNPYEDANWLGTFSKWHPATYDRLKKLPLRIKVARKPFTLKDLDTKIVFERVLEEKKEVIVKKEEISEREKERRRLEYEAEKERRHEEKMRMREQMLKKVEDEDKLLKFQLEAQQTMKQEADIEREEVKKREFFDKINRPNEKLEEYDLFKPYMNMDMMRVEDKVGHFLDRAQLDKVEPACESPEKMETDYQLDPNSHTVSSSVSQDAKSGMSSQQRKRIRENRVAASLELLSSVRNYSQNKKLLPFDIQISLEEITKKASAVLPQTQEKAEVPQEDELKQQQEKILPKNWKVAYDQDRKYYYNEITRKTQWKLPTFQQAEEHKLEEERVLKKLGDESKQLLSIMKESQDRSVDKSRDDDEATKKIKYKISKLAMKALKQFYSDTARVCRISDEADFNWLKKYWSKKIYTRCLRDACYQVERIEFDHDVQKAKYKFIESTMSKLGPVFDKVKFEASLKNRTIAHKV